MLELVIEIRVILPNTVYQFIYRIVILISEFIRGNH